jgi:dUTP pyrophosphatase
MGWFGQWDVGTMSEIWSFILNTFANYYTRRILFHNEYISTMLPSTTTHFSAGYPGYILRSNQDIIIPARGRALVGTDFRPYIAANTVGLVKPRSGLAIRHGIDVVGSVIDEHHHGAINVVLFNHSDHEFGIATGDFIARFIVIITSVPL